MTTLALREGSVNVPQFRDLIVKPALGYLGLSSEAAMQLVLGTAAQESGFHWIAQEKGPALGFFQTEPATLKDLYANFLAFQSKLLIPLSRLLGAWPGSPTQLATNPLYAAAVCRLIYFRAEQPLPAADDLTGLATYWKTHYNTADGAGTVAEWVANYKELCNG